MALSWNELSSDHKLVFLLEGLLNNKGPDTPMACRICDQVFVNNNSLLDHFQSHLHQNGTKLSSTSTQLTHSLSVPVNVLNSCPNGFVGPRGRDSVPPSPPNLVLMGNYPNPNSLPNSKLTHHRPPLYPSSSIIRSSVSQRTFASQFSQFHSRNVNSPIGLVKMGPVASEPTNFHFSSNPGTSGIARGTATSSIVATVGKNEIEDISNGYTKPYILQLEQPIAEMMADKNGESNGDEIDLTLKL